MSTSRPKYLQVVGIAATLAAVAVGCGGGSTAPSAKSTSSHQAISPIETGSAVPKPSQSGVPAPSPSKSAEPKADPSLSQLVLTQAEVSSATRQQAILRLFNGGTSVTDQATLDECGATYPTESQRQARIQVGYLSETKTGAPIETVSNEVVRYQPGAGYTAFHELSKALHSCPKRLSEGHGTTETDVAIQPQDPQLVTRQREFVAKLTTTGKNKGTLWSAAVFLYDDDLFDGVYDYQPTRAQALHVVQLLARVANDRLRQSVASTTTST